MHTATQLSASQFWIEEEGSRCTRADLLPEWSALDRLGVIVSRPLGGLGASLLIQLAITAFYDCRPERRAARGTIYPDFYVFHVGRRHGDHSWFDFWPERKEVLVRDPHALLEAVNDRAISRLLLPDGPAALIDYRAKEADAFRDRIASAFGYSSDGQLASGDVVIRGLVPDTEANVINTLSLPRTRGLIAARAAEDATDGEGSRWGTRYSRRLREVTVDERMAMTKTRRLLMTDGHITETYRRVDAGTALGLLGVGPWRRTTAHGIRR